LRALYNIVLTEDMNLDTLMVDKPKSSSSSCQSRQEVQEDTVDLAVRIASERYGRCSYAERVVYFGTLSIPVSVFENGEEAVERYVNVEMFNLDVEYGDTDHEDYSMNSEEVNQDDMMDVIYDALRLYELQCGEDDDE
jgi:hypothetical protein